MRGRAGEVPPPMNTEYQAGVKIEGSSQMQVGRGRGGEGRRGRETQINTRGGRGRGREGSLDWKVGSGSHHTDSTDFHNHLFGRRAGAGEARRLNATGPVTTPVRSIAGRNNFLTRDITHNTRAIPSSWGTGTSHAAAFWLSKYNMQHVILQFALNRRVYSGSVLRIDEKQKH